MKFNFQKWFLAVNSMKHLKLGILSVIVDLDLLEIESGTTKSIPFEDLPDNLKDLFNYLKKSHFEKSVYIVINSSIYSQGEGFGVINGDWIELNTSVFELSIVLSGSDMEITYNEL